MMFDVSEPNESRASQQPNEPSGDQPPERDSRVPEIVDAEVVENPPTPPSAPSEGASSAPDNDASSAPDNGASEDAQFRQYQQFLEFQRFQEMQRRHGTEDLVPPTGPPMPASVRDSWWKRTLWRTGMKIIRRLIYVIVFLLLAALALNWFFGGFLGGGSSESDGEYKPGEPPPPQPLLRQPDPGQAVIAVYDYIATDDYQRLEPGKPPLVCLLFNPSARSTFASVHNAPDCTTAARRLHEQVSEPMIYKYPKLGENALQEVYNPKFGGPQNTPNDAVVRSCQVNVDGGPRLGDFGLRREANGGWIIDSYEPPKC